MTELRDKRVAVVGFGAEGMATAQFLDSQGSKVTVLDEKTDIKVPKKHTKHLGVKYLQSLDKYDIIVPSPGVKRTKIHTKTPIVSATQIFLERCPTPVIGVTGTKGKGTTCS